MEWTVLLSSLDNHCRQIILLFRISRKRKNRSIRKAIDPTYSAVIALSGVGVELLGALIQD
jgi:hypothetical protein